MPDYHFDAHAGNDAHDGLTRATAFRSLARLADVPLAPGDSVRLRAGCVFVGSIDLLRGGEAGRPVVIEPYVVGSDTAPPPKIDAHGHLAAVRLRNVAHVVVRGLELTSDAGDSSAGSADEPARRRRFGVLISADAPGAFGSITLENLYIHGIFASESVEDEGLNPTSNRGMGIGVQLTHADARLSDIDITGSRIESIAHSGIRLNGFSPQDRDPADPHAGSDRHYIRNVRIVGNRLKYVGGPGMVPSRCQGLLVRDNVVEFTGSRVDPRMHMRGSGIWPVRSRDILIERNRFSHARGKGDSCGVHIDHHVTNAVVQYNVTHDNEGGFVEVLGDGVRCAYRYNVSIDDGFREKGVGGAKQHGKVLWMSGYRGAGADKAGPTFTYVYNNTVYVRPDATARFSIAPTTSGLLVANNVFRLLGPTFDVSDDQDTRGHDPNQRPQGVRFTHNLYARRDLLPASLDIVDEHPLIHDPTFARPGGTAAGDYEPTDPAALHGRGMPIAPLPGDTPNPASTPPDHDFFGRPVFNPPSIGAFEPLA